MGFYHPSSGWEDGRAEPPISLDISVPLPLNAPIIHWLAVG